MGVKPTVAVTMGDAAGIGPEIIVRAFSDPQLRTYCSPFVIGDLQHLRRAARVVESSLRFNPIADPSEATFAEGAIDVLDIPCIPSDLPWGEVSPAAGQGAYLFIEKAVSLALEHVVDAICTAPLNKEALHLAGHHYPGHTELLAALSDTVEVWMMLATSRMRVIHVTTHVGLIDAITKLDGGRVYRTIMRGDEILRRSGMAQPRIAVCAVNPHAGENGLFGNGEEELKVLPGVERARAEGIDVVGPLPADTLFYLAYRGDFDLVVALYHDQGHIPIKLLGLSDGVNVTVGLPFVRTSVDHGTAFNIAGRNRADHEPMLAALRQAAELSGVEGA